MKRFNEKDYKILIGEGDKILYKNLIRWLIPPGFEIINVPWTASALQLVLSKQYDCIIISLSQKNISDKLKLVEQIRSEDRKIPIILITRYSSEANAIAALKAGINDYFKEPFSYEELVASIKRNLVYFSQQSLSEHNEGVKDQRNDKSIIGESKVIQEIKSYIQKVAILDSTVLITGETGTGKELAAALIHKKSLRNNKELVSINCTALPESLIESELFGYERGAFTGAITSKKGHFELARGGTLFLDEIGDMNFYSQAKILRAIEKKEIYRLGGKSGITLNVRLIAATNRELECLVKEGKFREDLFYRLNVARVHLPPLRERKEDIPILIQHFIHDLNNRFGHEVTGFTDEAMCLLLNHSWPGNIRELKNCVETAFIDLPSWKVTYMELPKRCQEKLKGKKEYSGNEQDRILEALIAAKWNKSKAARKLNCSRMTLYRKLQKYNL